MYRKRYILDALYGKIFLPEYVWNILSAPELQRLREVRMCNINSFGLTGGANISRYEHSLGTTHLALTWLKSPPWGASTTSLRNFVLAALLHDVGSGAFGHSVQYVLTSDGFEHESLYDIAKPSYNEPAAKYSYQHVRTEPIYFGMPRRLGELVADTDLREISGIVAGRGDLGLLINNNIDLDNIDNVYRLAYHLGLIRSGEPALLLAQALKVVGGQLIIEDRAIPQVEDWYMTRRRLYQYLLLNPDEFSAKCMLEEALETSQSTSTHAFEWSDVDFELLTKLSTHSDRVSSIVSRLMVGELYGCIAIFVAHDVEASAHMQSLALRRTLELAIDAELRSSRSSEFRSASVAIHVIIDVNKTQREVEITGVSGEKYSIGTSSRRVLIGAFFRNSHLSASLIRRSHLTRHGITQIVQACIVSALGTVYLTEATLYEEEDSGYA